jgi:hypothetical protein
MQRQRPLSPPGVQQEERRQATQDAFLQLPTDDAFHCPLAHPKESRQSIEE